MDLAFSSCHPKSISSLPKLISATQQKAKLIVWITLGLLSDCYAFESKSLFGVVKSERNEGKSEIQTGAKNPLHDEQVFHRQLGEEATSWKTSASRLLVWTPCLLLSVLYIN